MVLLDEVLEGGSDWISCGVALQPESPFAEEGCVPGLVALEYMAQCVAAFAGLEARGKGEPVRIGYIIGIRRIGFQVESFPVGRTLTVNAKRVWGDDALGNFECRVEMDGRSVSTAVISVYQGDTNLPWVGQEAV
jgi:predicted hotdog family 3-hydroxylacyl-ACP dehydratase